MMDYDNLIKDLHEISEKNSVSLYKRGVCAEAANAIQTLQTENQALRQIQSNEMEGNMQRLKEGEHIFIVFGKDGKSVLDSQRRIRIYQSKENFEKFCPEPYNEVELVEYAPVQSHEEE